MRGRLERIRASLRGAAQRWVGRADFAGVVVVRDVREGTRMFVRRASGPRLPRLWRAPCWARPPVGAEPRSEAETVVDRCKRRATMAMLSVLFVVVWEGVIQGQVARGVRGGSNCIRHGLKSMRNMEHGRGRVRSLRDTVRSRKESAEVSRPSAFGGVEEALKASQRGRL